MCINKRNKSERSFLSIYRVKGLWELGGTDRRSLGTYTVIRKNLPSVCVCVCVGYLYMKIELQELNLFWFEPNIIVSTYKTLSL